MNLQNWICGLGLFLLVAGLPVISYLMILYRQLGRVTTGRVDGTFGQASLEADGMSLLIQVRVDAGTTLKKGDRAVIVSWDIGRASFLVEPYADFVSDR